MWLFKTSSYRQHTQHLKLFSQLSVITASIDFEVVVAKPVSSACCAGHVAAEGADRAGCGCAQAAATDRMLSFSNFLLSALQDMLQQRLQMEQDAAVHKQQLQTEKQQHALQLSQEALAAAQAEAQRLQQTHAQEMDLSEVMLLV